MAVAGSDTYFCNTCKRTMRADEFYGSNNLEKYPNGKLNTCKKCITMRVDNWDPETFVWILQECDVPWIPDEWNKLLATYGKDKTKVTGTTIIGRYLSKMKLKQSRDYRSKDTQFLQELADHKKEEAMKRQGYGAAEIAQVLMESRETIPEGDVPIPDISTPPHQTQNNMYGGEDYFDDGSDDELTKDLTDEDKLYLRLKWGKAYKPEEWVKLE